MNSKRTVLVVAHVGRPAALRSARLVVDRLTSAGVAVRILQPEAADPAPRLVGDHQCRHDQSELDHQHPPVVRAREAVDAADELPRHERPGDHRATDRDHGQGGEPPHDRLEVGPGTKGQDDQGQEHQASDPGGDAHDMDEVGDAAQPRPRTLDGMRDEARRESAVLFRPIGVGAETDCHHDRLTLYLAPILERYEKVTALSLD